jgi:SAM-dependent methyltransferase
MTNANYEGLNLLQPESETDPFTEERYMQFASLLPRAARQVLDVGCNTGRGGVVLKSVRPEVMLHGLDAVGARISALPAKVYDSGIQALSTAIPVPDMSYGAIVAGEFIEHIYARDVDLTLAEFYRVLEVGGRLLMTTPNPLDLKRRILGKSILGGAHVSQHFPSMLAIKLKMLGFCRIKTCGTGKVSRYLGTKFPLALYGSYMITADKR